MNRNLLIYSLFIIMSIITACGNKNQLEEVLMFADENRNELEKVLEYYEQDSLKKRAAEFLIQNIGNKRYFAGKQLEGYNQLFHLYDSLRCSENIIDGDPPAILKLWKELKKSTEYLTINN